jgi:hypothetical protein
MRLDEAVALARNPMIAWLGLGDPGGQLDPGQPAPTTASDPGPSSRRLCSPAADSGVKTRPGPGQASRDRAG